MPNTTPPINLEELLARKEICLVTRQISDTTQNLATSTTPLPKDHLVVDSEKQIIKIGNGVHPWAETPHHSHDTQYSTIIHGHYFGYGEKWFRSCPRLWSVTDLPHHPELIPCDGRTIGPEQYVFLQDVYDGASRATTAIDSDDTNKYNITVIDSENVTHPGGYLLFNEEDTFFSLSNMPPNTVVSFIYSFKTDVLRPKRYTIHSTPHAVGPKSWILEGATEEEPEVWTTLDVNTKNTTWGVNESIEVEIHDSVSNNYYLRYRLRVTSWYTNQSTATIGMHKFYITGRLFNEFKMPYIPTPSPEFVYVVPMKDLEIGMKHEEIGDVGYTSAYNLIAPINRLPLDGRSVTIVDNEHLYGVCGQKYAPLVTDSMATFVAGDPSTYTTVVELITPKIFGKIHIDSTLSDLYPTRMKIEIDVDGVFEHIDTVVYASKPEDMIFHLSPSDRASTKYRLTVLEWNRTIPSGNFVVLFQWYGSDPGKFFIPKVGNHALVNGDVIPYIVTRVRTEDINSSVVLELQEALLRAQNHIVMLTDRLTQAEIAIQNMSPGAPDPDPIIPDPEPEIPEEPEQPAEPGEPIEAPGEDEGEPIEDDEHPEEP